MNMLILITGLQLLAFKILFIKVIIHNEEVYNIIPSLMTARLLGHVTLGKDSSKAVFTRSKYRELLRHWQQKY